MVAVAALFHDWGKSSDHFQKKLRLSSLEKDPYRHEWVYCQLLAAVADISGDTQDDDAWMHLFLEGMLKKTTLKNEMKKHSDQADALPKMPPIMCFSFSKGFLLDDDDWNKAVKKWMAVCSGKKHSCSSSVLIQAWLCVRSFYMRGKP